MKYAVLLLKMLVFGSLVAIRLGEWDISYLYAGLKYRNSIDYYVTALSSVAIFLMLLDFVQFFTIWWYRRRHRVWGSDNFIIGVGHIYSLLLVIGVVVGILSLFRVHVRELFTSLSIIFAGLAILTKDYISNMINGMIMTFSSQLSIGDNVSILGEIFATTAAIGLYVAMALGYSTIYQAVVKLGVWRCVVDTLEIANIAVLDRVSAAGEPSSPVGEGLADALNVGGI